MSDDARTDVVEIYLELPPADIAFVKFILESYEGVGVMRTIDRTKALVVLMIAADFLDPRIVAIRGGVARGRATGRAGVTGPAQEASTSVLVVGADLARPKKYATPMLMM